MKIAILHSSLNPCGGGEKLALVTIEAFKERGWKVTLATIEPVEWERIKTLWGELILPDNTKYLVPFKVRKFGIYMRLLSSLMLPVLRKNHDIIINTHGDILIADADITYMHYPTFALWDLSYHKYEHGFWRIYFTPYYLIQKRLVYKYPNTLLLTNSNFSKETIRKVSGRDALVIYPPVDVKKYLKLDGLRRNSVVTIGRFAPEKRYEIIIKIAKMLPSVEFHIIGSVHGINYTYYEKIRQLIEINNLKNVFLHPNAPQKVVEEIIASSKVYLHAMINEHFGISVVEGLAGGLIPVVHRSGGAWTDIVEYGKYGYGYLNVKEAVFYIKKALNEYNRMIKRIRKSALRFSEDKYKKKIVQVVKAYYEYLQKYKTQYQTRESSL